MNIADFIHLASPAKPSGGKFVGYADPSDASVAKLIEDAEKQHAMIDHIYVVQDGAVADGTERGCLQGILSRWQSRYDSSRASVLTATSDLPESMRVSDGFDVLTKIAQTPKVATKDVRELADRLGMAVIPWTYVSEDSFSGEPYDTQQAIRSFVSQTEKWFVAYALCPVVFYDVKKHVDADEDLPIYAAPSMSQAFLAINMALPMFRTLSGSIKALQRGAKETDAQLQTIKQEMANLARRVSELQSQVEAQQREALAAKRQEARERFAAMRARVVAFDPMLIAIPKGATIRDDRLAVVGPCWGEDFPDIVMEALGMKAVKGQRARLTEGHKKWYSGPISAPVQRTYGSFFEDTHYCSYCDEPIMPEERREGICKRCLKRRSTVEAVTWVKGKKIIRNGNG